MPEITPDSAEDRDLTGDFSTFYREHAAFVGRQLRGHHVAEDAIDDVTQEVFWTAHRKRHSLQSRPGARSWLACIARFSASNWRRSGRRARAKLIAFAHTTPTSLPAHMAEGLLNRTLLAERLAHLDGPKRGVWILTEALGMTAVEISTYLGLKPTTVRSRLHAARQRLRPR
ncbi:MAG: RNA polymerase sigma factor [Nannocystaceae bacterium]